MVQRLLIAAALSAAVALNMVGQAFADQDNSGTKADNTKMNKEMRNKQEVSADQQGNSEADRKMTQEIRRAIQKEKSLSTYGHNVKVITKDGKVTLKGPVKSAQEKQQIGKVAGKVAGMDRVTNKLEVAAEK
jgi:osmotically-inducible protein OsmY